MSENQPPQIHEPREEVQHPVSRRVSDNLMLLIIAGIILGALLGGLFPPAGLAVSFLGELFLNALKMIVVPLVTLSIIVGITSLGDVRRLGPLGLRTVGYYLLTTTIAVILGLVLSLAIQPGAGVDTAGATTVAPTADVSTSPADALREMAVGLLPSNVIAAAAETEVLPLIVSALFFGGVLTTFGRRAEPLIDLLVLVNDVVMRMVHVIMLFAPLGIASLVAGRLGLAGGFSGFGPELMGLARYAFTVMAGLAIHGMVVIPFLLYLFARRSPLQYARSLSNALLTAFSTASSSGTLPLTYECVTEQAGVRPRVAGFVLPLGATINMDGTALYEAVAAIFIAQAFGIDLTVPQYVIVALTATLASIGAAGIPEAGLVTMIIVLEAVGLPVEGISLILAIDWFLDRCRTTVNVWGDAAGSAVIDRWDPGEAPPEDSVEAPGGA